VRMIVPRNCGLCARMQVVWIGVMHDGNLSVLGDVMTGYVRREPQSRRSQAQDWRVVQRVFPGLEAANCPLAPAPVPRSIMPTGRRRHL